MLKQSGKYIMITGIVFFLFSCSSAVPEDQIKKLADQYGNKQINNSQMLFEMGKVFYKNPENKNVRYEYFSKMIISGYSSYILHHLLQPENKVFEEDIPIVISALREGKQYHLSNSLNARYNGRLTGRLDQINTATDSLSYLNELIKSTNNAEAFAKRGQYFMQIGETAIANYDLDQSMDMVPCNPDAVFQKALILFDEENTGQIITLFEKCADVLNTGQAAWYEVFFQLAKNIETINKKHESIEEKLFRKANLYVNNGFPDLALRKSRELLKNNGENPDYLALQAFIHYRMNNRNLALQFITRADNIKGEKSKLHELIERMN
jgi:tetratricopeptide (TPR) repeat protein